MRETQSSWQKNGKYLVRSLQRALRRASPSALPHPSSLVDGMTRAGEKIWQPVDSQDEMSEILRYATQVLASVVAVLNLSTVHGQLVFYPGKPGVQIAKKPRSATFHLPWVSKQDHSTTWPKGRRQEIVLAALALAESQYHASEDESRVRLQISADPKNPLRAVVPSRRDEQTNFGSGPNLVARFGNALLAARDAAGASTKDERRYMVGALHRLHTNTTYLTPGAYDAQCREDRLLAVIQSPLRAMTDPQIGEEDADLRDLIDELLEKLTGKGGNDSGGSGGQNRTNMNGNSSRDENELSVRAAAAFAAGDLTDRAAEEREQGRSVRDIRKLIRTLAEAGTSDIPARHRPIFRKALQRSLRDLEADGYEDAAVVKLALDNRLLHHKAEIGGAVFLVSFVVMLVLFARQKPGAMKDPSVPDKPDIANYTGCIQFASPTSSASSFGGMADDQRTYEPGVNCRSTEDDKGRLVIQDMYYQVSTNGPKEVLVGDTRIRKFGTQYIIFKLSGATLIAMLDGEVEIERGRGPVTKTDRNSILLFSPADIEPIDVRRVDDDSIIESRLSPQDADLLRELRLQQLRRSRHLERIKAIDDKFVAREANPGIVISPAERQAYTIVYAYVINGRLRHDKREELAKTDHQLYEEVRALFGEGAGINIEP